MCHAADRSANATFLPHCHSGQLLDVGANVLQSLCPKGGIGKWVERGDAVLDTHLDSVLRWGTTLRYVVREGTFKGGDEELRRKVATQLRSFSMKWVVGKLGDEVVQRVEQPQRENRRNLGLLQVSMEASKDL